MGDAAKVWQAIGRAAPWSQLLTFLDRPARELPGVGPVVERALRRLLGNEEPRVRDLVTLLPRDWLDTRPTPAFALVVEGTAVTLEVTILRHVSARVRMRPHVAKAESEGVDLDLLWFGNELGWVERCYRPGETYRVHGRLGRRDGRLQIPHPELLPSGGRDMLLPIYPGTEGLARGIFRRLIGRVVRTVPEAPEWLPPPLVAAHSWPDWRLAWQWVHGLLLAETERPLFQAAWQRARRRLAMDELLALQLALALERARRTRAGGRSTVGAGELRKALLEVLPFRLTADQTKVAAVIADDQAAPRPMLRLLQGDVGSGKTLVAFLAMLQAAEAGRQAVLLAPTELLCRQHRATLGTWAEQIGLEVQMLAGGGRKREREATLAALASGKLRLLVGTHALLQDDVRFADLALAVIDEQHRFGVEQRLALAQKGTSIDLLFLSATPIPRTALLAAYGDIEVSSLRQKPDGRQPVRTRVVPRRRLAEVVAATGRALARGEQIYWVCPAVAPSEEVQAGAAIAAAEERYAELRTIFGERVGLAHGKQAAAVRERSMAGFRAGEIGLLVATTVVEVGVDVPAATVLIVESAERFGLSQLHQLRGRVGRGAAASSCLLVYDDAAGATARERLSVLRRTEDGFEIAEADLAMRGPGEVLGQRQSGLPAFAVADLALDQDLLEMARGLARRVLEDDPALSRPDHAPLRLLLRLHGREDALPVLGAG